MPHCIDVSSVLKIVRAPRARGEVRGVAMRVFSSLALIGMVIVAWSSGTATAQYQTEQEREAERLRLPTHDFPAVPIELAADVIVVLKPHVTFPLHLPTPTDRFVYGDI